MTVYKDKTKLLSDDDSHHYLDSITKQLATYLLEKIFGKDVRESFS
ncbi:hypothetical protein [Vagococcus intermedius]|uniref:Uncharacterized protein n=1 Tax=Vagococcus intermedius TaxID=2991418 RepID=A0AAF0CT69_9ENTE|nr:hypothetical protein [Vagococcus intermedius]WEG72387.1 hypothetical protein OL234_05225 [Vagococcus intermedius]WEG74475.1 hypothetical protein OL235_05230 [Vagococcus intermedius]